jgi:hypothetical protein
MPNTVYAAIQPGKQILKHEKYTYLAKAAPYVNVADPHALLAERIESLVAQEHAK